MTIADQRSSHGKAAAGTVRTLHHLACTGGTVISRCIAALPDVRLLSEVDPLSPMPDPDGRFFPTDLIRMMRLGTRPAGQATEVRMFQAALAVLQADSAAHGLDLVLRDHAHGQFNTGDRLPDRPTLREMVAEIAPVRSLVTVRHPFDSYLSLRKNGWCHFEPATPDTYALRYHAFLDRHADVAVMQYERFTGDPVPWIEQAADILDLAFDPAFLDAFPAITLSGDSGRSSDVISPRPRSPFPEDLRAEAHDSSAFMDLLDRLGYPPIARDSG